MAYVTFVTFIEDSPHLTWPSVNFTSRLNDALQPANSSTLLFLPELASGSAAVAHRLLCSRVPPYGMPPACRATTPPGRSRKRQRWTACAAGGGGAG